MQTQRLNRVQGSHSNSCWHGHACSQALLTALGKAYSSRSARRQNNRQQFILKAHRQQELNAWGHRQRQSKQCIHATSTDNASAMIQTEAAYPVLFAMVSKLIALEQQQKAATHGEYSEAQSALDKFIASRQEVISMPFLLWLAEQEAKAEGDMKQMLGQICQRLVVAREVQDQERFEELHHNTLALLAGQELDGHHSDQVMLQESSTLTQQADASIDQDDVVQQESTSITQLHPTSSSQITITDQLSIESLKDPVQYAVQLSEAATGTPVAVSGFSPLYDALLQAAPPASLSPEGLAVAHQQANELADDLRQRRKRSVASIIGRIKVAPEHQQQLMMGRPAARILDLLLSLETQEERVALLPDCFTPPSEDTSNNAPFQESADEETDELWCTPAQLLSEIESRLKATAVASQPAQSVDSQLLPPVAGELVGQELEDALLCLKEHVRNAWLASLPGAADNSAGTES